MPRVHISGSQNNLSIGVGLDEFLCKGASRPVTDRLEIVFVSQRRSLFVYIIYGIELPGSHQAAGPIPFCQTRPLHRTWRPKHHATSSSPEGSQHWRTSCGSTCHNPDARGLCEELEYRSQFDIAFFFYFTYDFFIHVDLLTHMQYRYGQHQGPVPSLAQCGGTCDGQCLCRW